MVQAERVLQADILTDVQSFGKYCESFKVMKSNKNGVPDVFFTTSHTGAVMIEVKKEDGTEKALQTKIINKLNRCGTKAFACYTWDEWINIKKKIGLTIDNVKKATLVIDKVNLK